MSQSAETLVCCDAPPAAPARSDTRRGLRQRLWAWLLFACHEWSVRIRLWIVRRYLKSQGVASPDAVFSFTSSLELAMLLELAMACPRGAVALEIGSHLGASARYLAAGLAKQGGRLYCVDTWNNDAMREGQRDTFAEFSRNTAAVSDVITQLRMRSTEVDISRIDGPISLLFIDGDHAYEGVKADFKHYEQVLAQDSVVAFHDATHYEGVGRFVGELLATGMWSVSGQVHSLVYLRRSNFSTAAHLFRKKPGL